MRPTDLKRPYDGSTPLFKIGLFPFMEAEWIELDDELGRYLDEKERLLKTNRDLVFVEEPDTEQAQREVLDRLVSHLLNHFPDRYERCDEGLMLRPLNRLVRLDDEGVPDLIKASLLVQDDLVLMRRGEDGWRLVAGCVCFPSSWDLNEKFGKPLQRIHAPVPQFGPGTRNASVIERIFDRLQAEHPVKRLNWSIYSDDALFHNQRSEVHRLRDESDLTTQTGYLRMETQTLTKLEQSGDILFTIRIHVEPMVHLRTGADSVRVCEGFAGLLERLDREQLAYKGLTKLRNRLVAEMREIARNAMAGAS